VCDQNMNVWLNMTIPDDHAPMLGSDDVFAENHSRFAIRVSLSGCTAVSVRKACLGDRATD
jgi:hypothetical protein